MRFFFYGTLRDDDVLALVIGRRLPVTARRPGWINSYRCVYRKGALYPILRPAPGCRVDGVLVGSLTAADRRRLDVFEGDEYRREAVSVHTGQQDQTRAWTYLPRPGVPATDVPWSLERWNLEHREQYVARVRRFRTPGP